MSLLLDKHGEPVGPPLSDHIELNCFEAGHPFQDVSEEQRLAALRAIAAAAKTEFEKSLKALQELVHQCDPISLLAHFGFYDLTFPYRDESIYSPAEQHQVEILQALILMIPESELSRVPPTPEQRLQANKLSEEITRGFIMYRIDPAKISPADSIREQARLATQSMRNPGYSDQVEKNLEELFDPLDGDLLAYRGVTFSGLIHLCRAFRERMEKRYNSLCQAFRRIRKEKTMEDMLRRFDSEFRVGEEVLEIFRGHIRSENLDADRLCAGLWNYSERVHPVVFAADIDELVADYPTAIERPVLSTALDAWSYRFGELASAKIEHLFLDNPVWRRPLLKINGHTYFWPIIGSFISFGLEMLEEQLAGNDGLKAKYHDRRATFLEQKVASLLSEALPSSTIYRNLVWFDPKQGETDAFALIDRHALIFECKSGRIKPSARRGGGSLFEEIKELIQEPTDQGCRFEALLGASKEPLKLEDKRGHVHEIQRARIKRVTRVNVLLDFFGVLACEYKLLSAAGLLAQIPIPAVTMSLVDLQNVVWMLESPLQFLHYLHRRGQFEAKTQVLGDEMDWLACYLAGMFDRWQFNEDLKLFIYMSSDALEPYFLRRSLLLPKKIPKLRLSQWWQAMLKRLEDRMFEGWTEIGLVLLSFPYHQQDEYRKFVDTIAADMHKDPALTVGKELIYGYCSQGGEELAIGTLVFPRVTREEVDRRMRNAMEAMYEHGPNRTRILILMPSQKIDAPYFRIAMEEPDSRATPA